MGALTGEDLDKSISGELTDVDHVTWDRDKDIFPAINQAQRAIVMLRPDALLSTENVILTQTLVQTIPTTGLVLFDVVRNRGTDGTTNGKAIIRMAKDTMNTCLPGWMAETSATRIRNYIFEEDKPTQFLVYPIPAAALQAEISFGDTPTDIETADDTISVPDSYEAAIIEFALYKCKMIEGNAATIGIANGHFKNFFNLLGVKMNNEITKMKLKGIV